MFFLQSVQAPVTVQLGNLKFIVPKFTMDDLIAWATDMAEKRNEINTQGMNSAQRAQYMTFYGQISVDFEEAKRLVRTPLGVEHVIRKCFLRAEVFRLLPQKGKPPREEKVPSLEEKHVQGMIEVNGIGRLAGLAWVLADLDEQAMLKDPTDPNGKERSEDPLLLLASAGSAKSVETGDEQSPSLKPRIRTKTGDE